MHFILQKNFLNGFHRKFNIKVEALVSYLKGDDVRLQSVWVGVPRWVKVPGVIVIVIFIVNIFNLTIIVVIIINE